MIRNSRPSCPYSCESCELCCSSFSSTACSARRAQIATVAAPQAPSTASTLRSTFRRASDSGAAEAPQAAASTLQAPVLLGSWTASQEVTGLAWLEGYCLAAVFGQGAQTAIRLFTPGRVPLLLDVQARRFCNTCAQAWHALQPCGAPNLAGREPCMT